MKISKLIVTTAVAAAASLASLQAGVAPAPVPAPVAPASSGFLGDVTGVLSAGTDSKYVFRGVNLGSNAIWTGLDLETPVADGIGLNFGAWYVNPTDYEQNQGAYGLVPDELDVYFALSTTLGAVDVSLGHVWYVYPAGREELDDSSELSLSASTEIAGIGLGVMYAYDYDLDVNYSEVSFGYGTSVVDGVDLEASVDIGFSGADYAHTTFIVSLPVALTETATLTPYVGWVVPTDDDDIEASVETDTDLYYGDEELFGGIALSVSF